MLYMIYNICVYTYDIYITPHVIMLKGIHCFAKNHRESLEIFSSIHYYLLFVPDTVAFSPESM